MSVNKLVLIRHGESVWNKANRFTGWVDVDLSEKGIKEADLAGDLLKAEGFEFDCAYTSLLKRAIKTLWAVLSKLDQAWIPVHKSWRLNERHYGSLQGLNKAETAEKHGKEQVFVWRRSYQTSPPELDRNHQEHPAKDRRYADVKSELLPNSEALMHTKDRVLPFWQDEILPAILSGKKVIVAAHGNSLRALIKHLDNVSDEEITQLNIPTGVPLVYELDESGNALKHYYLGNQEEAEKAAKAVAEQVKI